MKGEMMFTLEEMMEMSKEDFVKNWKNGSIQDSGLKLLGAREMNDEEKRHIESHEG
jgi:hypothetical protein